jgi:Na+-transporting methylmalonyl-CoA/oxaloacetate decarboxylase gamma subunit
MEEKVIYGAKKKFGRTEGIVFVVGLMFLACAMECSAQVANSRADDRTNMERMMPNHSPAALGFEPLSPPIESEQERLRKWELKEAEAERERIRRLVRAVQLEGLARGHELKAVPRGRRFRAGHVSATDGQGFTLTDPETQQEIHFQYSEIEAVYVVRSQGENAKRTVEGVGYGLLGIVTLPLMILAGIIGWDGC